MLKTAISLLMVFCLFGCSSGESLQKTEMEFEYFGEKKSAFGNVEASANFDWKQCEGVVLDFLTENNINVQLLSRECNRFTEVTGIKVNIKSMDFDTLAEKINIEFISNSAQYELIYVDPYQTLNRFHDNLEDLYIYENDPGIPHIVGGLESFPQENLAVCSYFENEDKLCAIPFDSTTMILFYRKDIFQKYQDEMIKDLGYQPIPGNADFTWERYIEVSHWISEHVPKSEIKYGSISASAKHNSIYAEFSNILSAYGGDYFSENNVSSLGIKTGDSIITDMESFTQALEIYKEVAFACNSESVTGNLNWTKTCEIFKKGEAAMMLNWDENAAAIENEKTSAVAGKTGYGVLPYGSKRSANIYGGSGIGINSNASPEKKLAAWLFIVWATSPQISMSAFLEENAGNMPTRDNLTHLISAQYMTVLPHVQAAVRVQKKSFSYYRPKLGNGYAFESIMIENLNDYITYDMDSGVVAEKIQRQWNEALK